MHLEENTAVILYDNSNSQWADLADRMMDFTRFRLSDIASRKQNCWIETKDVAKSLLDLPDKIKYAVVLTSGNLVTNPDIINQAVKHCKEERAAMVGHIIARHGYYHLHPQFFCLDVNLYKQYGGNLEPRSGPVTLTTPTVKRSETNVHDDYTPWWIKPADLNPQSVVIESDNFAQSFIAWIMCEGLRIVNVPESIRRHKMYSYVDYSHEDIRKFIQDSSYTLDQQGGIAQFLDYMRWTQKSLKDGFYVMNTENFVDCNQPAGSIRSFAGVCGGIKPAMIVSQPAFTDDCRCLLFDISPMAINWQKWLRQHWDGNFDNFESVFEQFLKAYPQAHPCYLGHLGIQGNIDWFLKGSFSRDQVYTAWQRWLKMPVDYLCCNMLDDVAQQQVVDFVKQQSGSGYIWTSNLFKMDWMMFYYGQDWAMAKNRDWYAKVKDSGLPIVVENLGLVNVYNH